MRINPLRILALDTSGERLLACRYGEGKTLALSLKAAARQDVLLDKVVDRLLPPSIHGRRAGVESALDVIAVGTGPGRFTGIRIGVAFAVVLGKALKVPVAGFRGLESLAFQESCRPHRPLRGHLPRGGRKIACALYSIRDEWFYGMFRIDGPGEIVALGDEKWGPRAELEKIAKDEGAEIYEGPLKAETLARRAEAFVKAGKALPAAEPYYLKLGNYEKK